MLEIPSRNSRLDKVTLNDERTQIAGENLYLNARLDKVTLNNERTQIAGENLNLNA